MIPILMNKLFIQVAIILVSFNCLFGSELISLYLNKDALTELKVAELDKSYASWELEKMSLGPFQIGNDASETLLIIQNMYFSSNITNFSLNKFNSALNPGDSPTFSVSSQERVLDIHFNFDFYYRKKISFGRLDELNSTGSANFFTLKFNYTEIYDTLNYELKNTISLEMKIEQFSVPDKKVEDPLMKLFSDKIVMYKVGEGIADRLEEGIKRYYAELNQNKTFNLQLDSTKKMWGVDSKFAINPKVYDSNALVQFMDGSIVDAPQFEVEDSQISAYNDFKNNSTLAASPFQLFIHKKLFINLLILDTLGLNLRFYHDDIESLRIPGVEQLNANWISKYYPVILDSYARSDNFYLQYTIKSYTFVNNNAKVDLEIFLIREAEVLMRFDMSYYVLPELVQGLTSQGKNGINFVIKGKENFQLISSKLCTPIHGKFDVRNFSSKLHEITLAVIGKLDYSLLRGFESFDSLLNGKQFNTVIVEKEGIVLAALPREAPDVDAPDVNEDQIYIFQDPNIFVDTEKKRFDGWQHAFDNVDWFKNSATKEIVDLKKRNIKINIKRENEEEELFIDRKFLE